MLLDMGLDMALILIMNDLTLEMWCVWGFLAQGHPTGAINVQVYRLIKEWTLWDISRRVAFAFFGIFQGTEENPEFLNGL